MQLRKLTILNFKNIVQEEIALSGSLNCFVGDNGTCKTNLLDSIYYLSMTKSSLSMTDSQCIRHGEEFMTIEGSYENSNGRTENVSCLYRRSEPKVVKRNGKQYEKLSAHIGLIPVVMVSPYDTSLVTDAAEERRRYLNAFISQVDPEYMRTLVAYNQVLQQRNSCLREHVGMDLVDVFDQQLDAYGSTLYARRSDVVSRLEPIVERLYAEISGEREKVKLTYRSELEQKGMAQLLAESRDRDMVLGYTSSGVHRDDLLFRMGDFPLRKFGSQGQQKSFLVALKLAQCEIIAELSGEKPILLLDDVFDKLDEQRVSNLVRVVTGPAFGQIFITDCNEERMARVLSGLKCDGMMFHVLDGRVDHETK